MILKTKRCNGTFTKIHSIATMLLLLCGVAALAADQPATPPGQAQPEKKDLSLDCGNGQALKLILIPAGEFQMGTPALIRGRLFNTVHGGPRPPEEKQHKVRITKPFYMGIYTVTQAQYEALMGTNPSRYQDGKSANRPVEMVSWADAVQFCKKLSEKTGRLLRLPTEAEWEYACRAGTTTPFYTGETITIKQANIREQFVSRDVWAESEVYHSTTPVGSYPPNWWGLYDMLGNVSQWCQDWYDGRYYNTSPVDDPPGPATGTWHVARGGSFDIKAGADYCRSASRKEFLEPDSERSWTKGFRVVCDCTPEEIRDAPKAPEPVPASQLSVWVDTDLIDSHGLTYVEELTFGDLKGQYDFIGELPRNTWKFRADPKQEGEQAGWFKSGLDLTGWRDMEIGRFWDDVFPEQMDDPTLRKKADTHWGGDELLTRTVTGYAWYRLDWTAPAVKVAKNSKLYLWFGAVDDQAVVWVNGVKVGSHEEPPDAGWDKRFPIDVTGALKLGKQNTIVVKVHNSEGAGGIWRPVKLAVAKAAAPAQSAPLAKPPVAQQPHQELALDCGAGQTLKMVAIPAGEFLMGTAEDFLIGEAANSSWSRGDKKYPVPDDEKPQHLVRITKPFFMGIYEVTQEQYKALMGPHKTFWHGQNLPVDSVTWYDAAEFCKRLSAKTGRLVRLPTEAEWEYAYRAGTTTTWYTGDSISHEQANFRPDWIKADGTKNMPPAEAAKFYHLEPVGKFPPNPWGFYNMAGGLWEWCQDWYGPHYYSKSPVNDPTGETAGIKRVLRGGAWENWPGEGLRAAFRMEPVAPAFYTSPGNGGFRERRTNSEMTADRLTEAEWPSRRG
jgi:formylglycine-generating enzyme required for sulfatase activity